jgi:hypothetical protein
MINQNLKIVSLNTHGLKTNTSYVKFLSLNYDIVFICEHWLVEDDKFILEELCLDRNLVFSAAETHEKKKEVGPKEGLLGS